MKILVATLTFLFLFTSCTSLLSKLESTATKVESISDDVQAFTGEFRKGLDAVKEKQKEMDTNQDGKVSFQELIYWLLGLAGVGTVGVQAVNKKRRENAAKLFDEVGQLKRELPPKSA